ncbi:hypothetical protein MRB53_007773 [Persea americana]|uniref:Uncharacterized protein n=1 Tax=Persea americana TaxID=3435 RepID=A0ACC2MKW3_PERAE|nr:hypothetical protein MRB53_007773 [Persea americana]
MSGNEFLQFKDAWCIALRKPITEIYPNFMCFLKKNCILSEQHYRGNKACLGVSCQIQQLKLPPYQAILCPGRACLLRLVWLSNCCCFEKLAK